MRSKQTAQSVGETIFAYDEVVERPCGPISDCLKCQSCSKIIDDATLVIDCLHLFCRSCINSLIEVGGYENKCPKCGSTMGIDPWKQGNIRRDPLLNDIALKLFPRDDVQDPTTVDAASSATRAASSAIATRRRAATLDPVAGSKTRDKASGPSTRESRTIPGATTNPAGGSGDRRDPGCATTATAPEKSQKKHNHASPAGRLQNARDVHTVTGPRPSMRVESRRGGRGRGAASMAATVAARSSSNREVVNRHANGNTTGGSSGRGGRGKKRKY
mmetsp:Transcript_12329/g.23558  ORF Transcript_12329/g.23558 Transcript_12329/m.23558 type:complete len:274 (+) Transcript_12329:107-928(+)